jgi:hypothetical protein
MRTFILTLIFALPLLSFTTISDGEPRVGIGGKYSGEISKEEIYKSPELNAQGFEIASFTFVIQSETMVIQKLGEGSKLSDEMLALIREAESGQKVYFENIRIKTKDDQDLKAPNLVLVLS